MPRLLVSATILMLALAAAAGAQEPALRVSGEIAAVDGSELRLKPAKGEAVTVHLAANLRMSARSAGSMELLLPGAYVGATAVPQPDGTLRATEVHVFPESMRGTGEGHRPMDAAPNTMTNATISKVGNDREREQPPASTMTNAAVTKVSSDSAERRLTLTYQGGEKVVIVPAGTPISIVESADRTLLTAGAHVVAFLVRRPDGSLQAERLTVGKNGFVP